MINILKSIFSKQDKEGLNTFKIDSAIKSISPSLLEKVDWSISENIDIPSGDLYGYWRNIPGAHKWHHYFSIYEKIFNVHRSRPIRVLEIGVYKGASVKMWKEYFHKETVIVGVDINANCSQFEDSESNLFIRIGSQDDNEFMKNVIDEFGKFDIIIDDGSHITSHMIASFNYLFENGLNNDGIYFVEDTHSNYWESYRNSEFSFVDLAKSTIDIMHSHYTLGKNEPDYRLGSEERIKSFNVPKLAKMIEEIRFFDSIIVFYKRYPKTVPVSEHL